jgi:hypothetical protein
MSTTTHPPLTGPTVLALAAIVAATQRGARVRRLVGDDVVSGTVRALVVSPERLTFPGSGDDIRDCYAHVSTTFELFWPVSELVAQFGTGELSLT